MKKGESNLLVIKFPHLVKGWHYKKNINYNLYTITCSSHKKVWWFCKNRHEYERSVASYVKTNKCPICSGVKIIKENSFAAKQPILIKEWDFEKNIIKPTEIAEKSHKKVWWVCKYGHHWEAIVSSRSAHNTNCPYCSNKKVDKSNSLEITHPKLAIQWHTKKNKIKPSEVVAGSNKKVWWVCKKGHEWESVVDKRKNGHNCPYCSNKKVDKSNSLETTHPKLAIQWHTKKNKIKPSEVVTGSHKKVWWVCKKGHKYIRLVIEQSKSKKCPICSGVKIIKENSFATKQPILLKEWNFEKNIIKPTEIAEKSNKKVWWKCKFGHTWETRVAKRTMGTGCPYCYLQSSKIELRIFTELGYFIKAVNRYKINNYEIDVLLPKYKIGIEYDSRYFHDKKYNFDKSKTMFFKRRGIVIYHVREFGLQPITNLDIQIKKNEEHKIIINKLFVKLLANNKFSISLKERFKKYINNKKFINNKYYNKLIRFLPKPIKENSFGYIYPHLVKEWDKNKNIGITPFDFTYGSGNKVWWICKKMGHSWLSSIDKRGRGSGCPTCYKLKFKKHPI